MRAHARTRRHENNVPQTLPLAAKNGRFLL